MKSSILSFYARLAVVATLSGVGSASAQLPSVPGATTTVLAQIPSVGPLDSSDNGTLWVTYYDGSGKVRRVAPSGQWTPFGPAISSGYCVLVDRTGAFTGSPGELIVGSPGGIYKIATDESSQVLWPSSAGGFDSPYGLYLDHSGRLLIANYGSGKVSVSTGGQPTYLFNSGLYLTTVAEDRAGRILVGGSGHYIKLYTSQGVLIDGEFVNTGGAGSPVWRGRGTFWGDMIYTINAAGQLMQVDTDGTKRVKGIGFGGYIVGLEFADDGVLYVSDYTQSRILKIAPDAPPDEIQATIQISAVDICWNSVSNSTYQVRYQSVLTTNQWTDLGTPITATNANTCVTDRLAGPQRFYQVVRLP